MRYPQTFRLLSPQRRANATEPFRIRFGDIRLLATYPGPPVDLRKAANGQSERMAAFGTAHFARERRGRAQCCQRIPSASGIENANSTIRPPPARYATLELAGGAGEIRSRLTSSAYAASFGMALSTNRKNRVLRARDLDLLSNIRSRSWIVQRLRSLPVAKIA